MSDEQVRLECLKISASLRQRRDEILELAVAFERFLRSGLSALDKTSPP